MKILDYILGRENLPGATHNESLASVPTRDELEDAQRDLSIYTQLINSPGWNGLAERLGEWADECLNLWTGGGLSFQETERLAATIDTLRKVLALPRQMRAQAEATIEEVAELERTTREPDSVLTDPEEGYL